MSLIDDLTALPAGRQITKAAPPAKHPRGWEPGVAFDGTKGTLTTEPLEKAPNDWAEILGIWGLDPAIHEIVGEVGFRAWDGATRNEDGTTGVQRLYYYRANVRLRQAGPRGDIDALIRAVQRHKPPKRANHDPVPETSAFVVCLADIQAGKPDGDGTEGTVKRFLEAIDAVEVRVRELRKCGRVIDTLYVMGLGDIIESCDGHYPMQAFGAELNLTEQIRLMRQLIVKALIRWSKLFDTVVVAAVQGNHGEVRRDGKAYTEFSDNFDTDVFKAAAEVLEANPEAFGHVSFAFPQGQETTLTLDVCGTVVGLVHGHQVRSGKALEWWAKQALGLEPIGEARLLLSGHYHHTRVEQSGRRTWIQTPALDGGSTWWTALSGQNSPAGVMTLVVGGGGWSDLCIL